MYEMAPAHLKAHFKDRMEMDPETRKADLAVRQAEAAAKHAAEIAAMTDKVIEQRKIEERIEEKQIEKEKVRQRKQDTPQAADPNSIKLKVVRMNDISEKNEKPYFLLEPYLIADSVVGFYGKGGSGKSSLLATMAAHISSVASTLWISTEETEANNLNRYMKGVQVKDGPLILGGHDATLQVFQTVVTKTDKDGRAVESMFNVYEHLEPAIIMANSNVQNLSHQKPVRLVVLDTIVALTTWDRQAGTNSDEGVKKLMAFLRGVAERQHVTIAVVGHANKGKHDHFADSVMGATAWTSSPRLSFMHAKDRTTDGQIIVRLAKGNEVPEFAQMFRLHMVHELAQIADGPKAGMFKVQPLARVWGGQDAEELWNEVTTPPKDNDEGEGGFTDKRKLTVAEVVRNKLVEMVHAGQDAFITREQVETQLPEVKVNRAQWAKVDLDLRQCEFIYRVELTTGQFNMTLYRPKLNAVPG